MTLSKKDLQFSSYLSGSFSPDYRALPQRSVDPRVSTDIVTFQIVDLHDIRRPQQLEIWWRALRPSLLTVTLAPTMSFWALWATSPQQSGTTPWLALAAIASLFLFQLSLHLFNDYYDHMSGKDRGPTRTGSQILQEGWLPAYAFRRAGFLLLLLSGVLALPILTSRPLALWLAVGSGFFGGLDFSLNRLRSWWPGLRELFLFLLSGPLLVGGFSDLLFGQVMWQALVLGSIFGLLTVTAFQLNGLEEIYLASQSRYNKTLSSFLGFENTKLLIYIFLSLATGLLFLLCADPYLGPQFALVAVIFLFLIHGLISRVRSSGSFASSQLYRVRYLALRIHWLLGILLGLWAGFRAHL